MSLRRLELHDFRSFTDAVFEPAPSGTTAVVGPNGAGKTTLLEALAFLATQRSFRGAPREAMVRTGAERAILRAELDRDGSPVLVEAELPAAARVRIQLNRRRSPDRRDLADAVPVTVFSPDDLALVQGGPAQRRDLLDDGLRLLDRPAAALADQVERVLRQRAALLRQAGGRATPEVAASLDVWDARLAAAGEGLAAARESLVAALRPLVAGAAATLAAAAGGTPDHDPATTAYRRSWEGPLGEALAAARRDDLRRGVSTVGPHRDDVALGLGGRDARTQASQGEQRSLALALRLALHQLVTDRRASPPVLLLDDVFSELDPGRSRALVHLLPPGQSLLTTAVPLPPDLPVALRVDAANLRVAAVGGR